MPTRRNFLKLSGTAFAAAAATRALAAAPQPVGGATTPAPAPETSGRAFWVATMDRIARPLLTNLAAGTLHKNMPVEVAPNGNRNDRAQYTHLEAFGRLLYGIAPWLTAEPENDAEKKIQQDLLALTQKSLDNTTNPQHPDFLNFAKGGQALVDTAFFAQGILRAKSALWDNADQRVKQQIINALVSSRRANTPTDSNWVMFAATVETALLDFAQPVQHDRLELDIRRMVGWYKGDGIYGDGTMFHYDYYNSYVIQPMLVDCLTVLAAHDNRFTPALTTVTQRAARYAQIQERLIAPDATFPVVGRSICYRFGAFQVLAQMSLLKKLPAALKPAQVRSALTAVIRKMISAPNTFDDQGFLRIGFYGHQPALAETYISTGSLYLCTAGMLPLGLPASDPFWKDPPAKWTSQQIWSSENLPADHAMNNDTINLTIPDAQ